MAAVHTPHPPIEGSDRLLGTIAVSLAIFMYGLDMAVANVSIPAITGNLGVSINQGTWVITSYAVANAIVIPLTGWLTSARSGCSSPPPCYSHCPPPSAAYPPAWKCWCSSAACRAPWPAP